MRADARRHTWKLLVVVLTVVLIDFSIHVQKTVGIDQMTSSASGVEIFDLSQPLEPSYIYENINCVGSHILSYSCILCVHNLENDVFVSASIVKQGVWENHVTRNYKFIDCPGLVDSFDFTVNSYFKNKFHTSTMQATIWTVLFLTSGLK